ncbi:FKBP-type peptidyl-prolyl cis-trans isomerase [Bowmanella yangjiangensis]|uniref:Peptidyl-prolyl cis-trans isomerase n=1 Tax=Bowmanella yangjiangensis TaxID=2811230 RepID=A0ABS3CR40_9ALTE|nr:peptidylprolyl isomerase [Bowmanella yangjiangensis]MBN7819567.1 peptidylprolyl isomerase [Bowmanella yangjiangensis]
MQIADNAVVRFHYEVKQQDGEVVDSSRDEQHPVAYLHGHNNIMPALEKAMVGKAAGDTLSVTLAPEDAYGEYQEGAEQRVSLKHLSGADKWQPGMLALVHTDHGQRQVLIKKVGKFMATVDLNHPLAGKTLTFDLEVIDVREATAEEVEHGHAHGEGGHHHH